jgi:hypothetical protein
MGRDVFFLSLVSTISVVKGASELEMFPIEPRSPRPRVWRRAQRVG